MTEALKIGLKENIVQFSLLAVVNAFVGAMVGLERTLLPEIAEKDFHIVAKSTVLSFIFVFGLTKALTNYTAGRLSDRIGRKWVLIVGWLIATPVPFMLIHAPNWNWIVVSNVFLGVSQGLTWSTTVIMKIDLVGSKNRGFAMGLSESVGYLAVSASAFLTGYIASEYSHRPEPFYLGFAYVFLGLILSFFLVKETKQYALQEAGHQHTPHLELVSANHS